MPTVTVDPLGMIKNKPGFPTLWPTGKIRKFVRIAQQAFDGTKKTEQIGVYLQMGLTELHNRSIRAAVRAFAILMTTAFVASAALAVIWDKRMRKVQRDAAATSQETLDEMRLLNFALVKSLRLQTDLLGR